MDSIFLTEARVYIAGVLMPTISAKVTCTFNQPPQAEIILPAYSELLYLGERDRVPVHIFVRETMVESPEFILMFEGFIAETGYINSALQRSVVVNAISFLDVLNDIKVKFMTQLNQMYEAVLNGSQNMYELVKTNALVFPAYLMTYGLVEDEDKPEGKPIRFPSDYLENIYAFAQKAHGPKNEEEFIDESTGEPWKDDPPLGPRHASALAQFYGKYTRMLKLLDRFERLPYFDEEGGDGYAWEVGQFTYEGADGEKATVFPLLYGMRQWAALTMLSRGAIDAAPQQSLMELLMFLVNEMEYEFLFITNPAYHARQIEVANSKDKKAITKEKRPAKLVSSCLKPLFNDTFPPLCNIMYRTLIDNISMNMRHKGVPTRVQVTSTYSSIEHLVHGITPTFLAMYGLVDYYPSDKYSNFDVADPMVQKGLGKQMKFIGTELLKEEEFTGPWIKQVGTPKWFHYIQPFATQGDKPEQNPPEIEVENGEKFPASKVFKERFFRRQLLNAKYFDRQLRMSGAFDPYVTPGFPGVVFDSGDSSFAFAGHVVTVVHQIMPGQVGTQVAMNFVRPLFEACEKEIPHPLISIHEVTHSKARLSEIYHRLLGSDAVTFKELAQLATDTSSETNCNNNINAAYKSKRRNICSFDEYLNFMDLKATFGDGPEGPKTPILLSGKLLDKRKDIEVYNNVVTYDKIIPKFEEILTKKDKNASQVSTVNTKYSANAGVTQVSNNSKYSANAGITQVSNTATGQAVKNTQQQQQQTNKEAKKEETKKTTTRELQSVNVRELLRSIAKREFARMLYK